MKLGNLLVNAAHLGSKALTAIAVGAAKVWEGVSKYIKFADPVVWQLCMKWSSDGIGLTPEDAAKVKDIGTTFKGNTEITSFEEFVEFNNVTTIVHSAFSGCTNLTTIKLPRGIKTLYNDAFNGCVKLTRIELNDGLTAMEPAVFLNCSSLTSIVIPNSVTRLAGSIFRGCSALVEAQIPSFVEGSLYGTFDGCANLSTSIIVPKGVTAISDRVFFGCKKVPSITFEDGSSLQSIGSYTFSGCSLLTSLIIPDGVTSIGRDCFNSCGKLTYIKLPSELITISPFAFYGAKLESIIIPEKVTSIGEGAFYNNGSEYAIIHAVEPPALANTNAFNKTYPIYVPDQSVTAYREATNWSAYVDRIKPLSEYQPTNE